MLTVADAERIAGGRVERLVTLSGGRNSDVYELDRGADPPLVLKAYPPEHPWRREKEVAVYALLAPLGLPIPAVVATGTTPFPHTLMTKLPGLPFSDARSELEPDDTAELFRQMGALLAQIHTVSMGEFGYLTGTGVVDASDSNEEYMGARIEKALREFSALGGDRATHDVVERHFEARADVFGRCTTPVLCHNDVHTANVLVEPAWRITGLVDVEGAVAADPLLDLAKTDVYAVRGDPRLHDELLGGYGQLPPDVEERLALYSLHHALELWNWFEEFGDAGDAGSAERLLGTIRRLAA
jgi:hygromycin-B 7''-O-kinase